MVQIRGGKSMPGSYCEYQSGTHISNCSDRGDDEHSDDRDLFDLRQDQCGWWR